LIRRLKSLPPNAVFLFADATLLRWFPPLRYAWAFCGEQAEVKITGRNAKRVLFGVINPRTGHRLVLRRFRQRQEDFQAFLRYLRRYYSNRPIWLLLDKASCHEATRSREVAEQLDVTLLWLPKQCPELNPMDHLWKELKRRVVANRQFQTIDEEAKIAERWLLGLTPTEALRKAGILSGGFWLKKFM
jgi:transposase